MEKRSKSYAGLSVPEWIIAFLILIICIQFAKFAALSLLFPYQLEYGEGVLANWILRNSQGLPLYPRNPPEAYPWLHNPYGPLYYEILSPFASLSTNPFIAPRLFSFIAFLFIIYLLYNILRSSYTVKGSFAGLILFAASPIVWRYVVMARVDLPALAFMLLSVWLLWKAEMCSSIFANFADKKKIFQMRFLCLALTFLSAVIATFALMIKLIFVSALLTGLFVSFRRSRLFFFAYLMGTLFSALCIFAYFEFLRGWGAVFEHWGWMNAVRFDPLNIPLHFLSWCGRHPFIFICLFASLFFVRTWDQFKIFSFVNLLIFGIFTAKEGASGNYFLPIILSAVIMLKTLKSFADNSNSTMRQAVIYCLLVQFCIYLPFSPKPVFSATYGLEIPPGVESFMPTDTDLQIGRALVDEIESAYDKIFCESPGYILSAHKLAEFQPYQYGKLASIGKINMEKLIALVENSHFNLIIIQEKENKSGSLYMPAKFAETVRENYDLKRKIGEWNVYIPRRLD